MTDSQAGVGIGGASGTLSVSDQPNPTPPPPTSAPETGDQFSAVINIHDCNLHQIEMAVMANAHMLDPHPATPGTSVRRHPVYLVAFDGSTLDAQGHPAPGAPLDVDMDTARRIFSGRYNYVSAEAPPEDGSHIRVAGMHTIAELDSAGQPTGRVRLGNPDEVSA